MLCSPFQDSAKSVNRAVLNQPAYAGRSPGADNMWLAPTASGLINAALNHFVRGDEAQAIAERGPMPLHLADIHLHRARLFRDRSELAQARTLIEKHGYGRRKEELADAEAAAASWK